MNLDGIMERAAHSNAPNTGDYMGQDGLLYCGKCHTPKQCRIEFDGKPRVVFCMCACKKQRQEQEQRDMEQRERQGKIDQLRVQGIQDKQLLTHTFGNSQQTLFLTQCWNYVNHWRQMRDNNTGLLLWGDVGCGKSHAAACIANALIDHGIPVLVTSFPKIIAELQGNYQVNRNEYLRSFQRFSLLVLDDFGVERSSDYVFETMFSIIDERYKSGKPLIITTNLTPDAMRRTNDIVKQRIYDRIQEMCIPVRCSTQPWRRHAAAQKLEQAKSVLL